MTRYGPRFQARPVLALGATLAALLAGAPPSGVWAQEADGWTAEAEFGGLLFFGNTSATTLTARSSVAQADSTREISANGAYTYGEATDPDGDDFVNKRSWAAGLALDYHPFATWSPFVFARLEGSLQQRIDLRTNLGAGVKLTMADSDAGELDVSLAVLGERTTSSGIDADIEELFRWSGRLRGRRELADGRVTLTSETFWKPTVESLGEYTLTSTNSLAFVLSDQISLKVSFVDSYDTEAKARGARSNNEGQILLTVQSAL